MQFIDLEDLTNIISINELIELSDLNGTMKMDESILNAANTKAINLITSFILLPTNPTRLLKEICADLTIIELKKNQNFPKTAYEDNLKNCIDLLIKMASKKLPTEQNNEKKPIIRDRAFKHNDIKNKWDKING